MFIRMIMTLPQKTSNSAFITCPCQYGIFCNSFEVEIFMTKEYQQDHHTVGHLYITALVT